MTWWDFIFLEEIKLSKYDYLVVGAGLFGAVFAHEAALRGIRAKPVIIAI